MRREHGQGTIEYVAVVALVALLFTVGGTFVAAPGVANAVGRALQRALCQVTGGGCEAVTPQPCVVRATTLKGGVTAKIALLKVGRDSAIVRSERSDGTIEVTLLDRLAAGIAGALGAKARVEIGEADLGAGAMAEAQLIAALGGGRTWKLRGARAADRFVRRLEGVLAGRAASGLPGIGIALNVGQRLLGKGAHAKLPEPDSRTVSAGLEGEAKALLGPLAGVKGKLGGVLGRKRGRDGTTTWLLTLNGEVAAPLAAAAGVVGGGSRGGGGSGRSTSAGAAAVSGGAGVSLALTYDRHGQPQTLRLGASGALARSGAMPSTLGAGTRATGRTVQVSAALDLTDPDDRARAGAVVRALAPGHGGGLARAVADLAAAIADHAALDVATYRDDRDAVGFDVAAGAGVQAGVSAELSRTRQRLTGAWSRPPGGAWEARLDCVGARP